MSVCAKCSAEIWRWRDTTPRILRAGIRISNHAAYDDTAHGMATNRRRRWEDWRDLVVHQTGLIRAHCAAEHHGQTALFDLDGAA